MEKFGRFDNEVKDLLWSSTNTQINIRDFFQAPKWTFGRVYAYNVQYTYLMLCLKLHFPTYRNNYNKKFRFVFSLISVNMTSRLLWPFYPGPKVVILTGDHCTCNWNFTFNGFFNLKKRLKENQRNCAHKTNEQTKKIKETFIVIIQKRLTGI